MISAHVRAAALLAVCLTSATTASAGQASYRIVLYMEKYDQPAGFAEGSPGVFYGVAGSYTHVGFSVTSQGGMTVLASFRADITYSRCSPPHRTTGFTPPCR